MKEAQAKRRVTLQDVANYTGYSVTAVSRALRNMSDIGPEATASIKAAAARLGYVVNKTAAALRSGRTQILTVVLVNMTNPFFCVLTNLVQEVARQMGYSLIMVCSNNDPQLEHQLIEQAIERRSDGVLLFPTNNSGPSIEMLQRVGIPFVLLSHHMDGYQTDSVIIDDEQGAYLAVSHLIGAGCRKIAFLSGSSSVPSCRARKAGFLKACDKAGLPAENRRILPVEALQVEVVNLPQYRGELIQTLRSLREEGFTGLFIFCDSEAWRVMSVISRSEDLSTRDFSIASFDNIDGALVTPVPLCSVDCGLDTMAREGMALLHARIEGDTSPIKTILCPVSLVCRGSCHRR